MTLNACTDVLTDDHWRVQDTFLDADHLKQSFPEYDVEFKENGDGKAVRPFRITFPEQPSQEQSASKGKRKVHAPSCMSLSVVAVILPHPYQHAQM